MSTTEREMQRVMTEMHGIRNSMRLAHSPRGLPVTAPIWDPWGRGW